MDLERAIAALPRGARRVFVLHDVEGYTHEEIGGFLGIALPLVPRVGLGTTALLLVAVAAWVLSGVRRDPVRPAAA